MYMSLFSTCGWVLRLGVTVALLVSVHPALALLLVFALPTVLTSTWRPGVERATEERVASAGRLARHLFVDGHDRGRPARRCGSRASARGSCASGAPRGSAGTARCRRRGGRAPRGTRSRGPSSAPATSGRSSSSSSGLARVARRACSSCSPPARGSRRTSARPSARSASCAGIWLDGSRRLTWLEDYAAAQSAVGRPAGARPRCATASASSTSRSRYPGTDRLVLDDVDLHLPAGSRRGARRRERRRQDARW